MTNIPNNLCIESYMHCGKCLKELPPDTSPQEFSDTQAGFTKQGVQIWCNRHECNILHIHFEGFKHPANATYENKKRTKLSLV